MELNKNNKQVDNKKSILLMNILNQEGNLEQQKPTSFS